MNSRAQSEALSFVFVFGIIITTIAVVFAFGYPGLQQIQDVERVNNAERALTSLADSVDEQVQQGAPSRATEVKLADASLSVGDVETITVSGSFGTAEVVSRPLVYDSGTGTQLTYASGMVARQQSSGMAAIRDPSFVVTEEATVLAIPRVQSYDSSIGGRASVLVRTERGDSAPIVAQTTTDTVTVTIESPRAELWRAYFEDRFDEEAANGNDLNGSCSPTAGGVECTFTTGKMYVTAVPIDLSFS